MVCTAYLVCVICTVNGCSKKSLGCGGDSRGHITNLKQSTFYFIMESTQKHFFVGFAPSKVKLVVVVINS
jgi:hypothetical protein